MTAVSLPWLDGLALSLAATGSRDDDLDEQPSDQQLSLPASMVKTLSEAAADLYAGRARGVRITRSSCYLY